MVVPGWLLASHPCCAVSGMTLRQGVNQALAAVKPRVLSKNVQWDLVELVGGDLLTGLRAALRLKLGI